MEIVVQTEIVYVFKYMHENELIYLKMIMYLQSGFI